MNATMPAVDPKTAAGLATHDDDDTGGSTQVDGHEVDETAAAAPEKKGSEPRPYVVLKLTEDFTDGLVGKSFEVIKADVQATSTKNAIKAALDGEPNGEDSYVAVTARSFKVETPKAKVTTSLAW